MASSSSSALERSIASPKVYDAFISHRGPDVKDTLAKKLYERLQERGCQAFLDRPEIEGGDSIFSAISNGIRSSAVQIAIFSKGYAESQWCLDELVLMLEQTEAGALFIPVFYDVKPSELRYIKDKSQYASAFSTYESNDRNLDRLDVWKKALKSAADLSGYELSQYAADISGYERSRREDDLCEKIVSRVLKEMKKRMPLPVAKFPVALDEIVQDFEKNYSEKAGLVGIFGLGGSGKSTLAKELFNRKRDEYKASCFLSDVRESQARNGLHSLQRQLLKDLFDDQQELRNVDDGIARLKLRLGGARDWKFLIVLDDVDHLDQLDILILQLEGVLSSCSLVIITTRDQSVLTAADVTIKYPMKPMDRDRAKELFCSHSFPGRNLPFPYERLVERFIDFCGGLPISLMVLGAHVRGKGERYWKLELEKVKKITPQEIMHRLKISFDGLDKEEKQIFIDIACFFNKKDFLVRQDRVPRTDSVPFRRPTSVSIRLHGPREEIFYVDSTEPISIWKMSGWSAEHAVHILQNKCLIEVKIEDAYWRFEMHDHLRDLGRQLADDLVPRRLWKPEILRSMEEKGFEHILAETKARCFNSFWDSSLESNINYFVGSLNDYSETELLWLEINRHGGALEQFPSWIPLRRLQYLFVTLMDETWNRFQQQMQSNTQATFELRRLRIFSTPYMPVSQRFKPRHPRTLELGQLQRLNILELQTCFDLQTISGLSSLTGLRSLHMRDCYRLETIADLSSLTRLESLHVQRCPKLQTIFRLSSLTGLQSLHVHECPKCEIMFCEEFKALQTIANLCNLEEIAILGCGQVQSVQGFEELKDLRRLVLQVSENGYAFVRNCVNGLRRLPSEYTVLIGGAVDEAMSRLNVNLFAEVIDGPTIREIGGEEYLVSMRSSSSAITVYALLYDCGMIEFSARLGTPYFDRFESGGGHMMITAVLPPRSQFKFEVFCRRHWYLRRVLKGFKARVSEGEEDKALTLLRSLIDRVYG
ncbi:disease resistance protein Roq1 isoform X2 [Cryptomeria japonica]|uniref:disease resistance protein Roq1 isoform X2 n=1 Tax=Cryptomeria japonica TaxID=3369 RepID=UPI0027DA043C|nr:disease resistance protein Roq1 isoform X2 [Cryptomeria japonica]